ncbi:MAG: hypothetical protein V7K19_08550 [Nostoc sp.]
MPQKAVGAASEAVRVQFLDLHQVLKLNLLPSTVEFGKYAL